MLTKLLTLLGTTKGAAVAAVIAAAAVAGGITATNPDVQRGLGEAMDNVTRGGQPAVVAARNAADKQLREAFQDDQTKLEKLHSTKVDGPDRQKLDDIVNDADAKLRARLTTALDDVAALTLGREGLESAKPSGSPSAKPTGSPDVKVSFTPASQAAVDAIVTAAIADMDKIVTDATAAVAALPTADVPRGGPSAKPTR
jgi:hypothetical protein